MRKIEQEKVSQDTSKKLNRTISPSSYFPVSEWETFGEKFNHTATRHSIDGELFVHGLNGRSPTVSLLTIVLTW